MGEYGSRYTKNALEVTRTTSVIHLLTKHISVRTIKGCILLHKNSAQYIKAEKYDKLRRQGKRLDSLSLHFWTYRDYSFKSYLLSLVKTNYIQFIHHRRTRAYPAGPFKTKQKNF